MLELRGVSKFYQNQGNVVLGLRRVSATFNKGEFVAITGESGSGKSTLLNVISGLDKYDEGELLLNGESTSYFTIADLEKYRKEYIGFVFQDYNIIDAYTVYENVVAALVLQNYPKKKRKARALDLIERVGWTKQKNQKTSKLSGGQKQRVVIARALAKDAPIIVADEPTGNLDAKSGEMIMALLKEVSKDKLVIVVTHNYEQVKEHVTRKIHMFDGEIVEDKVISKVDEGVIIPATNKPTNLSGHLYFSWTNILRNPKKTIILLLSYVVLMAGTLVTVAARKQSLLDPMYYYHPFVENTFDTRVLVKKKDDSNFTNEEIEELYGNNYTKSVIHFDHVLDIVYSFKDSNNSQDGYYITLMLTPSSANTEIKEGRAPLNDKEIVIPDWYKGITKIHLNYGWNSINVLPFDVVGYNNEGRYIVHDSFLNQTTEQKIVESDFFVKTKLGGSVGYVMSIMGTNEGHAINRDIIRKNETLSDKIIVSRGFLIERTLELSNDDLVHITMFSDFYEKTGTYSVTIVEDNEAYLEVPSDIYVDLEESTTNQVSVILKDKLDANRFIKSLDNKYMALHPSSYRPGGTNIFSIGAIFLGLNALIFSIIILNIVVKNIYKAKNKDIAIMRSIGASKKDVRKIYILETVLTVFISTIFTIIAVFLLGKYAFKQNLLKILGASTTLLYVALFLLIGLWAINRFLNRLFGRTVIYTLRGNSDD